MTAKECAGLYVWPTREAAQAAHDAAWRAAVAQRTGSAPVIRYFDLQMLLDNEAGTVTEWSKSGEKRRQNRARCGRKHNLNSKGRDRSMPKSVDVEDFAVKLALLAKRLNWSRAKLAQQVGVDKSLAARWFNGNSRPSGNSLMQLTSAVAQAIDGFTAADWDLTPEQFSRRLGIDGAVRNPAGRGPRQARLTLSGLRNPPPAANLGRGVCRTLGRLLSELHQSRRCADVRERIPARRRRTAPCPTRTDSFAAKARRSRRTTTSMRSAKSCRSTII